MKKAFVIILILSIGIASCKVVVNNMTGVNKDRTFKSSEEYLLYANETNDLPQDMLLAIDSTKYNVFIQEVIAKKLNYYYGAFINDSTEVIKSDFLNENGGCSGRILSDLKVDIIRARIHTIKNDIFKTDLFHFIKDNNSFHYSNNGKLYIFLLYSYKLGTLRKRDYSKIITFARQNKDQVELYIISLDNHIGR